MKGRLRYSVLDAALGLDVVPDNVLRAGVRASARRQNVRLLAGGPDAIDSRLAAMVRRMQSGPIAEAPTMANEQHYELPAEFFGLFLGPWRKYSCGYWSEDVTTLEDAEAAMLDLTCRRAGIEKGMSVLDLGCGWGAMSFWLAQQEGANVVAVSNSHAQRRWIETECKRRGLQDRVTAITCDINEFDPEQRFDRVISIEMFEHLRNWAELLRRVSTWLEVDGKAFVHVFCHRHVAYQFSGTWAAERFFAEGTMPSRDLLPRFDEHLSVTESWPVTGDHYGRTLNCWLERLDQRRDHALNLLGGQVSHFRARELLATWRLFLLATSEMWGAGNDSDWMVSHYLLDHRGR